LMLGWRAAALLSGVGVLLLLPLALLVRRSPESMGLLPDGERRSADDGALGRVPRAGPRLLAPSLDDDTPCRVARDRVRRGSC